MRKRKIYKLPAYTIWLALTVIMLSSCGLNNMRTEKVILVSAAASLKESVEEIAAAYEQDHPDIQIRFNYGSSGTLQKQIEQGAPADLFLSAGRKQMDALESKKLVKESAVVLANRLVVIASGSSAGKAGSVDQLLSPGIRNIALGEPDSVPAGEYARQSLRALGLWEKIQRQIVFARDVRQVLAYVETGNAEFGFVYRTDALHSDKVRIAAEIPDTVHEPIVYPFGLLAGAKNPKQAADFLHYLSSDPAMKVFADNGFIQP